MIPVDNLLQSSLLPSHIPHRSAQNRTIGDNSLCVKLHIHVHDRRALTVVGRFQISRFRLC